MKKLFQNSVFAILLLLCWMVVVAWAADTKLSALSELAAAPAESDELYINDGGTSKKITVLNLLNALEAALTDFAIHQDNLPATLTSLDFGGFTATRPVYSDGDGKLQAGDGGGDIEISGDDLEIKANAVTNNEMGDDAIGMDEIDDDGDFTSLTGDLKTTGYMSGQLNVQTDASGGITMTVNAVNYGTDTGDADIPDGACDAAGDVGNWVCLISSAADQYALTSNDASNQFTITDNASALTAGNELDVDGTMVCVTCIAAELWKVTGYMGDVPTDGGGAD
jgi:hypothetical protein